MKPQKITREWLQNQLSSVEVGTRAHARNGDTATYRALLARREQLEAELKLVDQRADKSFDRELVA